MKHMKIIGLLLAVCVGLMGMTVGAQDAPLKVVASFSILADVVQNVGLDNVEVTSLIPVGADPHSYEPSAQDLRVLAEADVVFVVGANFEEALLEAITNAVSADVPVIEASACVPMRAFGAHTHDHDGEEEAPADHVDEEAHDDDHAEAPADGVLDVEALCAPYEAYIEAVNEQKMGMLTAPRTADNDEVIGRLHGGACGLGHENDHADEAESEEEHDHAEGACDPHVWSDPMNVLYWTLTIRDTLSQWDAAKADVYAANADEYVYALADHLTNVIHPLIESIPAEKRVLLTNHETLGYFAAAYGFEMVGFVLPGGSAFAEPSAQDIAALVDLIRAEGVAAVFAETTISAVVAEQVAAEAGIAFYGLYTDSLSAPDGDAPTYLDYLTYNVQTIATALTGE